MVYFDSEHWWQHLHTSMHILQGHDHSSLLVANLVRKTLNLVDFHTWIFWQDVRPLQWWYQPAYEIYVCYGC